MKEFANGFYDRKSSYDKEEDERLLKKLKNRMKNVDSITRKRYEQQIQRYKKQIKILEQKNNMDLSQEVSKTTKKPKESLKTSLLSSLSKLSVTERAESIREIEEFLNEHKSNLLLPDGVPPLPKPDPTGKTYPVFAPVKDKIHPYEFLEHHPLWSKMLKHFNTSLDRDYLFQDQLQTLDKSLYNSLIGKRQSMKKSLGFSLQDIIPPKTVRKNYELSQLKEDNMKEQARLLNLAKKRKII